MSPEKPPLSALERESQQLILVGGKGGVGKSTVAVNVASALKETGAKVGIMDADIYGPSIPPMLGIETQPVIQDGKMVPPEAFGMPVMSIGFLVKSDDALIWRGPILHQVLGQFVRDVVWKELDYLIVDLPPGTGDVQISLAQLVHASGVLLVTTPQDIAFRDVRRAAVMFGKVDIPIIGLVENMGAFKCPHCGTETVIFPRSDDSSTREITHGIFVDTLGRIPIEPEIAQSSEKGVPIVVSHPESETAKTFRELAGRIAQQLSILAECKPRESAVPAGSTDQD